MPNEEAQESVGKWRKSKGMSQAALAEKIGVSQATASRIEAGERPAEEVERALRRLGYTGPLTRAPVNGLAAQLDHIEAAMTELKKRGIKPATYEKAHELRKLVAKVLEEFSGTPEALAERVESWIRMAEAIRK